MNKKKKRTKEQEIYRETEQKQKNKYSKRTHAKRKENTDGWTKNTPGVQQQNRSRVPSPAGDATGSTTNTQPKKEAKQNQHKNLKKKTVKQT